MQNDLRKHLKESDPEQLAEMMDILHSEEMMDPEVLKRIESRLDRKIAAEKRDSRKTRRHSPWKVAALTAAAALVAFVAVGMTVPGVSKALYGLVHPEYRTFEYMNTPPENRTEVPEVQANIRGTAARDVSYSVELLGDYSIITGYDEDYNKMATDTPTLRETYGFPPYRQEDYAYLKSLVPEVKEVLYDGQRLVINTYFPCDYASEFMIGWGYQDVPHRHNLDLTTFDVHGIVNGTDVDSLLGGCGTGTALTFEPFGETLTGEQVQALDGFWLQTDFDALMSPLPDGTCTLTLLYYIYDGDVDDMGAIGNVARVIHTIEFDTTAGNHAGDTFSTTTPLTGTSVVTCTFWPDPANPGQGLRFQNRTLSLEGVELETEASFLQTGMICSVRISKTPESWDETEKEDLTDSLVEALDFDLYIDGELLKSPDRISSAQRFEKRYEIPVFPGDYGNAKELVLVPKTSACKAVTVYPSSIIDGREMEEKGERFELIPDADPVVIPSSEFSASWDESAEAYSSVLTGCGIRIPVPQAKGTAEKETSDTPILTAADDLGDKVRADITNGGTDSVLAFPYTPDDRLIPMTVIHGNTIANTVFNFKWIRAEQVLQFYEKGIVCTMRFTPDGGKVPDGYASAEEFDRDMESFFRPSDGSEPGWYITYDLCRYSGSYEAYERRQPIYADPSYSYDPNTHTVSLSFVLPVTPDEYTELGVFEKIPPIDPAVSVSIIHAVKYDGKEVGEDWTMDGFDPAKVGYGRWEWFGTTLGMWDYSGFAQGGPVINTWDPAYHG